MSVVNVLAENLHFQSVLSAIKQVLSWIVEPDVCRLPIDNMVWLGAVGLSSVKTAEVTKKLVNILDNASIVDQATHVVWEKSEAVYGPVVGEVVCVAWVGRCEIQIGHVDWRLNNIGHTAIRVLRSAPIGSVQIVIPRIVRWRILRWSLAHYAGKSKQIH